MGNIIDNQIIEEIRNLLIQSRTNLQQTVNSIMVQIYWQIGKIIVEDEQKGNKRANYAKQQLLHISNALSKEFGKGFDTRNLRNMRQFYQTFPIWNSVSAKLSWTYYRTIMRIDNQDARQWYINETIQNLPSEEELKRELLRERELIEDLKENNNDK